MIAAIAAALGGEAALVGVDADCETATVIDAIRTARAGDVVVVVLTPAVPALPRAMILAALGSLAHELAPRRVAAIDVAENAEVERVVAAARFLAAAQSTTGQVFRVV